MNGYRDGRPVVNCDVCHAPICNEKGFRIYETRAPFQYQRTDGWVMDAHVECQSKADSVKASERAEPEDADAS